MSLSVLLQRAELAERRWQGRQGAAGQVQLLEMVRRRTGEASKGEKPESGQRFEPSAHACFCPSDFVPKWLETTGPHLGGTF